MQCRRIPLSIAGLLLMFSTLLHATSLPEQVDELTQKWLDIEKQITAIESHWRQSEPTLHQRIELLKVERAQLKTLLSENREQGSDVEAKREALLSQQNTLEAQQSALEKVLLPLSSMVDALYPTLPDILRARWDDENAELAADASASLHLQVILAKLSSLHTFNNAITVHESVMNTPDEKTVVMKQLYLGSAYAWFTNSDGRYRGIGNSLSGRWEWSFDNEFKTLDSNQFDSISTAIAVYEKQRQPEYVLLPLDLQLEGDK